MTNFKSTFCILTLGLFLIGCSSSSEPEMIIAGEGGSETSAKITYDKDVKTIIDNSCATSRCHDSSNPAAGLSLTNYSQVKSITSGDVLIERINNASDPMPASGRLPAPTRAIIEKWKTDGLLEK